MDRRTYLGVLGTAGVLGVTGVGVGLAESNQTLSDPTLVGDSKRRRSLEFATDGEAIANFGGDGTVDAGRVDVDTELWHADWTRVQSIGLTVSMPSPSGDATADVAVRSPVEGDSSPPPSITLSTPADRSGTRIEIRDFDDLADETISTLGLTVDPPAGADTLAFDVEIDLGNTRALEGGYRLTGRFVLEFPSLGNR